MAAIEPNTAPRRGPLAVLVAVIVLAVVVLAAFMSMRKGELPVRAEKAQRSTIVATISTNGKIDPVQNFEAHAPGAASVKAVHVKEGDWVKADQLLVQLDDAPARAAAARAEAQLRAAEVTLSAVKKGGSQEEVLTTRAEAVKARSELEAAQRNLEALQRLQKTGAASAAEVTEGQNRVKAAQAQVELTQGKQTSRYSPEEMRHAQAQEEEARAALSAAQDVLANSNIRAPRAGMVYSLPVRPGVFVNSGDLLVQVADLHTVTVRAFVDEPDIGRLARGQHVDITWDAVPGRIWQGSITNVPTTVTLRGTRTVGEITCEVDNRDLKLLPAVNVSVTVTTARHEGTVTVAREAVHQEDGQRFVYQVTDNNLLKRVPVQTGISNLTRIEIDKGLGDNVMVALGTTNGQMLRDNMPVRVVQR